MEDQTYGLSSKNPEPYVTASSVRGNTSSRAKIGSRSSSAFESSLFQTKDIAYITIGMLGIVDNLFAIGVMTLHKPLRRRLATWLLVNKNIQDLLAGALLVLVNTVGTSERPSGAAYELYCRLWTSKALFLGLFTSSLFSLVALTLEKHLEIVHPIRHRVQMTKAKVVGSIALLTSLALGYKIAFAAGSSSIVAGNCVIFQYPNFGTQATAATLNFLIEFLVPLTIVAYSYVSIVLTLRKTVNPTSSSTQKDLNPRMVRARNNVIKTLLIVVLAFVVCVSGKQILLLLQSYRVYKINYSSWIYVLAQTMSFMSCCVDPFIYLFNYLEFRRGAKMLLSRAFPCCCRTTRVVNDEHESTTVKTIEAY